MAVVQWRKEDQIAVIEMCNGANRMNPEFAGAFARCLDEVEADLGVMSLVITSTDEKNFSQGIDVEWIGGALHQGKSQDVKDFMYQMNAIFKRLLLYPVPVIAAINGHAFGNGAILSCACDFRFMKKDKGFFCFPEVDVSIPFLPGMLAFVRKAIPEYCFNEMLLSGKRMTAQELEDAHVILKASENQEELMIDALAYAGTYAKKRGIFKELKKRAHKKTVAVLDQEDPEFIEPLNLFVAE